MSERRYGQWAGNPRGQAEDTSRCIESVYPNTRGGHEHQCQRKRGYGPDGLYCKIHDPAAVKQRQKESERKYQMEWERSYAIPRLKDAVVDAVRRMRNGEDMEGYAQAVADAVAAVDEIDALMGKKEEGE